MSADRSPLPGSSGPDREQSGDRVSVTLSRQAAVFLRATVEHMNQIKILPCGEREALETSAWLEEIEAGTREALR